MARFSATDRPTLNPQKLWKGFPSDPVELLLLAHVNGQNSAQDLSVFCARTVEQTIALLDRLADLGILAAPRSVTAPAPDAAPRTAAASPAARAASPTPSAGSPTPSAGSPAPEAAAQTSPEATLVDRRFLKKLGELDTSVLAETVDLEPRRKEEILLLFHSLSQLTPFQLFGVPGDTTDRDVKRAYQRLSLRFHPDRYFGKNLGSFKPMMERIFRVISESLELLATEESRRRLEPVYPEAFAAAGSSVPEPTVETSDPGSTELSGEEEGHPVGGPRTSRPHRRVGLRNQIASVLSRANSNSIVSGDSDEDEEPAAAPSIILPPPGGYKTPPTRMDPLHRAAQERAQRVSVHLSEGKRALEAKNYGTAASHFKTVLSLDPRHEEASRLYQEADGKNRETMGASYAARARMEEEMRDLQRASELWSMAAELSPTVEILGGATQCFSKLLNHAKAREYAQRAVALFPKPETMLLLANVYIAAGMGLRAQTTLKELLEKFPGHAEAQRLMRVAQKMK